ncbi:hypothetical protein ERO13_D01G085625v2 [Gossypium hirsutum]|uniref:NAC domain-containing protein n=1 Tax=Gossypium darwinii TaxID=34276 RepID=A0A5D2DNW8_GOSDA|nr:hypothetical protein ERO13_D01G085625v2 [Gossypium hirsutum]TYG82756.1 hypothetical protein ES288_D01G115300v1 [Gossypium darwinii]
MATRNGQLSVPPGFRFHPTEEELLYYYLRKKVSFEAIELDVIREVDLNKLVPWDLKGHYSYITLRYAGRDRAVHLSNSKRVGMRKTLVFYTGRALHVQKTDWIMHEYRLDDDDSDQVQVWVKKTTWLTSGLLLLLLNWKQGHNHLQASYDYSFDASINLPQLFSPESAAVASSFISPLSLNSMDIESSRNLLRQASTGGSCGLMQQDQISPSLQLDVGTSSQKVPFRYLGCEADILKISKQLHLISDAYDFAFSS